MCYLLPSNEKEMIDMHNLERFDRRTNHDTETLGGPSEQKHRAVIVEVGGLCHGTYLTCPS